MKLHNELSNKHCIGKTITACIGLNKSWVRYEDGNNGEKDYYRDVFGIDILTGKGDIVYMDREYCIIKDFNIENETVLLRNDSENVEFEIPYHQYKEDFGIDW